MRFHIEEDERYPDYSLVTKEQFIGTQNSDDSYKLWENNSVEFTEEELEIYKQFLEIRQKFESICAEKLEND